MAQRAASAVRESSVHAAILKAQLANAVLNAGAEKDAGTVTEAEMQAGAVESDLGVAEMQVAVKKMTKAVEGVQEATVMKDTGVKDAATPSRAVEGRRGV